LPNFTNIVAGKMKSLVPSGEITLSMAHFVRSQINGRLSYISVDDDGPI